MSSTSNVGDRRTYESNDNKGNDQDLQEMRERFEEGKANSHDPLDSKDERSIANRLERESKREEEQDKAKTLEEEAHKKDATLPAKMKGNEPSKGAKIDQELREEEEEILKKKGAFGPNV